MIILKPTEGELKIEIEAETEESEEKVFENVKRWVMENFLDLKKVKYKVVGKKTISND